MATKIDKLFIKCNFSQTYFTNKGKKTGFTCRNVSFKACL